MNGDKILLLRRSIHETSNHGMYELPGGKPDGNETMVQTAIKETYEESGLNVKIIKTLEPHIDSDMKKVYHGFMAIVEGDDEVILSEEHDDYRWVSIRDAMKMDAPLSHHAMFMFNQVVQANL